MKKIILIFVLLLFSCLTAFAEYRPIPQNLSEQYKLEMEQIINKEYVNVIKKVNENVKNAEKLRDKILKNGYNIKDYADLTLISEVCIPAADLDLYAKLVQVTQEKYLRENFSFTDTDSTITYSEILIPYFQNNNVNIKKLLEIGRYENKKRKIVEKYIKQVEITKQ